MDVCMYIYIYIYICMHVCIYIYIRKVLKRGGWAHRFSSLCFMSICLCVLCV